jgi:hypothetical protein
MVRDDQMRIADIACLADGVAILNEKPTCFPQQTVSVAR